LLAFNYPIISRTCNSYALFPKILVWQDGEIQSIKGLEKAKKINHLQNIFYEKKMGETIEKFVIKFHQQRRND